MWGGQYTGAKDMMHFDWRNGGDAKKIDQKRRVDKPNR
jgi:hypothetical protein